MTASETETGNRHWIVRSKLEVPKRNPRLISRPRLFELMDRWLELDLAVLVGPAGYAKSTAAAEWCRAKRNEGIHVAWLSLDEADSEPAQFVSYLIASLSNAGLSLNGLETSAEEGFFAGGLDTAINSLIDALTQSGMTAVLVLDDYHRVRSHRVDELLKRLIDAGTSELTILVTTRNPMPFEIAGLLASGRAEEIGTAELKFTKDELASLFPHVADEQVIDLLFDRTEGWPVAVQLAGLAATGSPTQEDLANFHGDTGHLASYLAEQVVNRLDSELQRFLFYTSLIETFGPGVASAITEIANVEQQISKLERLGTLVVPVSEKGSSFRYHHLFGEFLQKEFTQRYGNQALAEVHHRASQWHEAHGEMADAVRHARLSGDVRRCAQLVENAGGWELILFGGIGYLRGLLQNVTDEVARESPRILLAKSYLALKDGNLADARTLLDTAVNAIGPGENLPEFARDLLNVRSLVEVYEDRSSIADDITAVRREVDETPSDDPLTKSILACRLIVAELSIGEFAEAEHRANATMRTMREARSVLGLNYCVLHAGLAALYQGRLQAAEAQFGVARRMAEENFAYDPGLRALSRILACALRYWQGEGATISIEDLRVDLDQVENYDGWLDIYSCGLLAEAGLIGDPRAAVVRGKRIAAIRKLPRLDLFADAIGLASSMDRERTSIALKLRQDLPSDIWRKTPFLWLPFLESRIALAAYYAPIDRTQAIEALREGLDCAHSFGASIYAVRFLVTRAALYDLAGRRSNALDDIIEALTLAAPERIVGPFLRGSGVGPLLRAIPRHAQDAFIDILVVEFASSIASQLAERTGGEGGATPAGLSQREREVLDELCMGRTNKEIARLLDMTEHTVKFHLKNIFVKLDVERRTEAVVRARELGLI